MIKFPIDSTEGVDWNLFSEDTVGFTSQEAPNIALVLCLVKCVFEELFGTDTVNSHATLSVVHGEGFPTTFRENKIIFLSSEGSHYLQHVFQFSHELCHFMVPDYVCMSYGWLEETMCQMMSLHVLSQIQKVDLPHPLCELFKPRISIEDYIHDAINPVDLGSEPFHRFFWRILPDIQKDSCKRDENDTIALQIYPLFVENSSLWKIVPMLHTIKDNTPLDDALKAIATAADIPENLIARLIACFYEDTPVTQQ